MQFPQVDITQVLDSARVVEVDGFVKLHCFPTENSKELIYFVLFKNKINNNYHVVLLHMLPTTVLSRFNT